MVYKPIYYIAIGRTMFLSSDVSKGNRLLFSFKMLDLQRRQKVFFNQSRLVWIEQRENIVLLNLLERHTFIISSGVFLEYLVSLSAL